MSTPIPVGFCQCGCCQQTNLVTITNRRKGLTKGQPRRYLLGHNKTRTANPNYDSFSSETTRTCRTCCKTKSLRDFRTHSTKDECKDCWRKYQKEHRAKNPDSYRLSNLRSLLKTKYYISEEEYLAIHQKQKGICAICKDTIRAKGNKRYDRLCIDHDHVTGKVRGLLCWRCNSGLGLLDDNADIVRSALNYLASNG